MTTRPPASRQRAARPRSDPATRVLRRFRTVFNAVRSHFRNIEQKVGISGAQVWALSQIAAHPGMRVSQLAGSMDIHQSTASNLLRGLLEAGLVKSAKGEADRRSVHLHATARGLRLLAKSPTPFTGGLPDALQRLDAQVLERLEQDLARLIGELKADPKMARVPIGSDP